MCNSSFDAWLYVGGGGGGTIRKVSGSPDEMPPNIHISRAATNIDLRAVAAHVLVVNAFLL